MRVLILRKQHKKKIKSITTEFLGKVSFGIYGIKAYSFGFITTKQVEAARRILVRATKKISIIKIRVHFYISNTKKSLGSRMGKGKGNFKELISIVFTGMVLFEISNVSFQIIHIAFKLLKLWFPINLKLVKREVVLK